MEGLAYEVAYEYEAAGNRKTIEVPGGAQASTSYAGLRPSAMSITAGSRTEAITDLAWYPFGPRTSAKLPPHDGTSNTVASSRSVNLRGQITELDVFRSGAALVDRSYTYDFTSGAPGPNDPGPSLDRVVDHLLPAESRFYFYDELDRLRKATDLSGAALHQYAYDAVGNRTNTTSSAGTTSYAYESGTDRLDASTGASALDYAHDAYGSRIYQGTTAFSETPSLVYDQSNRLVAVKDPANGYATVATYTYDAFGRRVKKVANGVTTLFFYDTEGRLVSEVAKHAGPANDAWRFYVFLDDEVVGVVDDVAEVGASTAWLLPGRSRPLPPPVAAMVLFAIAGVGVVLVTRRVPAGLATTTSGAAVLLLCAQSGGGTAHFAWVHVDPLGTPLAATSSPVPYAAAQVIWRASYEPFGKAAVDEDPDGNSIDFALKVRFSGQYEDAETGWHYNFYRTYDPQTGRYLEADPIGQVGGINVYLYGDGDPLNRIDPTGLTYLEFDRATGRLHVDPEMPDSPRRPYSIPATSGRDECTNIPKCEDESDRGPIPGGQYLLNASGLRRQNGWRALNQLRRGRGDWGSFYAPLTPYPCNPTSRHSFYLHGGWFPGSAGCIDVGGGPWGSRITDQLVNDILGDPDGVIPLFVR